MGLLLSSFRRKRTTFQVLEELEKDIRTIEQYGYSTEQRRRRVVGVLMVFSIGIYGLSMLFFYLYFRLTNWKEILVYSTPLFVFPFIVVFVRFLLTYYYEWKLKRNKEKLIDMRAEKKRILEEVMDKETYKYAKEILDKFGESKDALPAFSLAQSTPVKSPMPHLGPASQLRQRQLQSSTPSRLTPGIDRSLTPLPAARKPIGFESMSAVQQQQLAVMPATNSQLPRPILTSGGPFDRLVDYLVGDGPGSRYALICAKCSGHNGMALPEEFEYLSYRCAYCGFPNPARKQKPRAPPLMTTPVHVRTSTPATAPPVSDNDSDAEKNSDKDSDDEAVPTPLEQTIEDRKNDESVKLEDGKETE